MIRSRTWSARLPRSTLSARSTWSARRTWSARNTFSAIWVLGNVLGRSSATRVVYWVGSRFDSSQMRCGIKVARIGALIASESLASKHKSQLWLATARNIMDTTAVEIQIVSSLAYESKSLSTWPFDYRRARTSLWSQRSCWMGCTMMRCHAELSIFFVCKWVCCNLGFRFSGASSRRERTRR